MMASNLKKLDPKTLIAGVIGYTGETGKILTAEILKNNIFKSTFLIGRRNVEYKEDFYKRAVQKVVDFDKLIEYDDAFKNIDVIFCCLGTTRARPDGYKKVDFDYVYESAKMAKKNGCKQFHLITSSSANKNSLFLYIRLKGQIEEAVSNLNFEKAAFYRPMLILTNRADAGIHEKMAILFSKPFQYLAPRLLTTPVETLAKSLIANSIYIQQDEKPVEIIDNNKIFDFAKLYDDNKL